MTSGVSEQGPGQASSAQMTMGWPWRPTQLLKQILFCQPLIQHLIFTFTRFIIFLRKSNKNAKRLKDQVRSVTGGTGG